MNMNLQLIIPSLVLPLALSFAFFLLSQRLPLLRWGIALIWLPSCFWLVGLPEDFVPQEANQWLWLALVASTLLTISLRAKHNMTSAFFHSAIFIITMIILVFPVLKHSLDFSLSVELLALIITGGMLIGYLSFNKNNSTTPSLTLAICSGGLGIVSALGGSLLMGQLAGALAASLGAFSLYEVYKKLNTSNASTLQHIPLLLVYFSLLLIARVYAEIPVSSAFLLLIAPIALALRYSYSFAWSILCIGLSLGWLLLTADSSSYY